MARDYPDQPVVGVGVVVWRGAQCLLIRRGRPPRIDEWSLPGGRQELGETVAAAGQREVLEETGVRVAIQDVIAVVDLIDRDEQEQIRFHYTLIDLLGEWQSGEATANDDAAAVVWATLDELPQYRLWSETERIIRLAAQRRQERRHADRPA
ncbi:MAG: NUDIX hydrolase [Chloroflexota bacterium]|nr:NUDIX hydrolase [Chloroflexota bacterium]PLS83480.1 MAG: phosphohydrolase [Chloroflexota bacterium]